MPLLFLAATTDPILPVPVVLPGEGFKTWILRINGVDQSIRVAKRSLSVELTRGARGVMKLDLVDVEKGSAAFRAKLDQEVTFDVEADRRFGGYINDIGESPISGISGGTKQSITAGSYEQLFDQIDLTAEFGTRLVPILNSVGAPAMLTTDGAHGFVTGTRVQISNHLSASPDINGIWIATVAGPVNFTIPVNLVAPGGAGTVRQVWRLREVLQYIQATVLAPYGITLDPDMDEGPYMDPMSFVNATITDVWNTITTQTGRMFRLSGTKVLSNFVPGTRYAPLAFSAGVNVNGPAQVSVSRAQYANRIVLTIGGTQKIPTTQFFVAAAGGGVHRYVTDYPASLDISDPWPTELFVDGLALGPISWGEDVSFGWVWDYASHTLIDKGTAPIPAGSLIWVGYTIQYPISIVEFDPEDVRMPPLGSGPKTKRLDAPGVYNMDQGRSIARFELRKAMTDTRRLVFGSVGGFALPGDLAPCDVPSRIVEGFWMIESVKQSLMAPKLFYYEYTFTEGNALPATWQDSIKDLTGQSGTASGSVGGTTQVISTSLPPMPAIPPAQAAYFLGGPGNVADQGAAGEWIPVTGRPIGSTAIQIEPKVTGAAKVHVRLKARNAAIGVTARLYDATDAAEVGISAKVIAQVWTTQTFDVHVIAGHAYELHMQPDTPNEDVFASGYLQQ
jgi:hypothetical protein